MNFQTIQYFITAAELENLSKAADFLHVSQSALSKAIANMEKEIGVPLFVRTGKKLSLKPEGARLLESCKTILAEMDSAKKEITLMSSGTINRIRIWCSEVPESFYECLSDFRNAYSNTEYIIDWQIGFDSLPDINTYDMIIYPEDSKFTKYKGLHFYENRFMLALSNTHPLAKKGAVSTQALDGLDYVFMKSEAGSPEFIYDTFSALTIRMHSCSFTTSRDAHRRMIASGFAVGLVSKENCEVYQKDKNISLIPLMDSRFHQQMMVCFKREKRLSELGMAFMNHFIDYYRLDS